MTAQKYRELIASLELTQQQAGVLLGFSERTGQRWATDGPPLVVAMLLHAVDDRKALDRLRKKASHGRET